MVPRFDYFLMLLVVGAIAGGALARVAARFDPIRLARGYLVVVAAVTAVRAVAFVAAIVLGLTVVRSIGAAIWRDATTLLLGGLYGLAAVDARRGALKAFLAAPDVLLALRLTTGVAFVLVGLGDAFVIDRMIAFFARAGYPKEFLHFIMTIEVLGGVALLLPWRWLTLAATAGLAMDMFGAIYTHLSVGETIDECTQAIAMLLRLGTIAILSMRPGRRRWVVVAGWAVGCALVAVAGGTYLRSR